jgi:hypothetical protein
LYLGAMNNLSAKQVAEQVSPTDPMLRLAELLIRIDRRENVIKDEDDVNDNRDTDNTSQA